MTFTVLVACSANVCRSPLTAVTLERAFALDELSRRIVLDTGGIDVLPGDPVCADAVRMAESRGIRSPTLTGHRARSLTVPQIGAADLVLAADRRVRSSIVKRVPDAAARTFTLREAGQLGREATREIAGRTVEERLRSYVAAMNASRGLVDLPRTHYLLTPSAPWRRLVVHAHDVPDAHQNERAPHRAVYHLVAAGARDVARGLRACTPALRS
jgi:protein-tyrosine phosphatase